MLCMWTACWVPHNKLSQCVWPLTSRPNEGWWDCCSFWSLQCDLLPEYTEDHWKCQDVPKVIAVERRTKSYLQEVYSSNIVRSRVGCFREDRMAVSELENWGKRKDVAEWNVPFKVKEMPPEPEDKQENAEFWRLKSKIRENEYFVRIDLTDKLEMQKVEDGGLNVAYCFCCFL